MSDLPYKNLVQLLILWAGYGSINRGPVLVPHIRVVLLELLCFEAALVLVPEVSLLLPLLCQQLAAFYFPVTAVHMELDMLLSPEGKEGQGLLTAPHRSTGHGHDNGFVTPGVCTCYETEMQRCAPGWAPAFKQGGDSVSRYLWCSGGHACKWIVQFSSVQL